jgi:pimeloyl-ACP methyl ester carboxylesterase
MDSSVPRLSQLTKKFLLDRVLESKAARNIIRAVFPLARAFPSKTYSREERRTLGFLTRTRFYNQTMQNEKDRMQGNLRELMDKTCPASVPVGFVLSNETSALLDKLHFGASWKELHEALIPGNAFGKIVEINAGHYLHRTHPEVVSDMISEMFASQASN